MTRAALLPAILLALLLPATAAQAQTPPVRDMPTFIQKQWSLYCRYFHDKNNNNGWSGCANEDSIKPNGDLDVEGILFKPTIPLQDEGTYVATRTLLQHLVQPDLKPAVADDSLKGADSRINALFRQHISGALSIAYDTVANIVGRRTPVAPSEQEQIDAWTPLPPPEAVIPPKDGATALPARPNKALLDTAVGDEVAFAYQRMGKLDGGQCPDNDKQACGFFHCGDGQTPNPNIQGGTCTGRPPSAIIETIKALPDEMLRGRYVLLSTGIQHQAEDCATGTSQLIIDEVNALKARNVLGVVVSNLCGTGYGSSNPNPLGETMGQNKIDINALGECITATMNNTFANDPSVKESGVYLVCPDGITPEDPIVIGSNASTLQSHMKRANTLLSLQPPSVTNPPPDSFCDDGTPAPCFGGQ